MRNHGRQDGLGCQQRAAQADVQHGLIVCFGNIKKFTRLGDPGVVDQDVDAARLTHDFRGRLFQRGLVGHVGDQANVAGTQARCGTRRICRLEIEDDHARALRRHHLRRAESEPVGTGAAGDYRYLVFEQHVPISSMKNLGAIFDL